MKNIRQQGFVLISVLFFVVLLIALLGAYLLITHLELASTKHAKDSIGGFAAGEAGLNIRAEEIRNIFVGYNQPSGASPSSTNPCTSGNKGSGDYACKDFTFDHNNVVTYLSEDADNPIKTTIPVGERYQNLNAQEYRYTVFSVAKGSQNQTESILQLKFKSRLVPMFQFAAFYDKDLEIAPGAEMSLSGPIHTNGDLYLNADGSNNLNIYGQITSAGDIYRGKKRDDACSGYVNIIAPVSLKSMLSGCSKRTKVTNFSTWKGMVESNVEKLTVPSPEILNPTPSSNYFSLADLRLQLQLNTANESIGVVVLNSNGSENSTETASLNTCSGNIDGQAVGSTNTFYNNREKKYIRMLEIDLRSLLNCLYSSKWLGGASRILSDDSEGGLVFNFSLQGPDADKSSNGYGVRILNASSLASSESGAPAIKGLTIVTNQAIYLQGNYNSVNKKPAAIMADSFNILSNAWSDSKKSWSQRIASSTTIYTAVLSGTDSTGGIEGTLGQGGTYNGGLENYPRLHEQWTNQTLTYKGSFVSLNTPKHVTGSWIYGNPQYSAPIRTWDYDTDFNNGDNLPPMSPRFVYLRQELFVRSF